MNKKFSGVLYYASLLTFSIKIPFLLITGPYLLSLVGLLHLKGLTRNEIIWWLSLLAYFVVIYLFNIMTSDLLEFMKSFTNVLLFVSAFVLVAYFFKTDKISYRVLRYISLGILIFAIIQVLGLLFLNDDRFFHMLDPVSISTATDVGRFQASNLLWYVRPVSIYHEPSFFGLISLVLLHVNYVSVKRFSFINVIAILLSMSSTAIFFLMIYYVWVSGKKMIVFASLASVILLITFSQYTRINEIYQPGTSGHERLIRPITDLALNYSRFIFAVPLGNLMPQTNNSLQLLFAYCGVFSGLLLPLFFRVYKFLPVILCILMTNGAFLTPDGAILLATTLYAKAKL